MTFIERATGCSNLFDDEQLPLHTAVQDSLHAHALLHRDVDYVVAGGRVLTVDEFKGRLVPERRWPAGLHIALEAKEGVHRHPEGRVLGSITVEHLVAMYSRVAGMTGTAATQADELQEVYGLEVTTIPPHRPVVRVDNPDTIFPTRAEKDAAVRDEIRRVHATGRPILVGTPSVEESERLSGALHDVPHHVLNARNEAAEAAIIARAGERGAVTISTNMAGRGVDIRLGDGVDALGGLYVIATHRHESRRIDHQLRGRAGRQGDPGSSRFFVSLEDPLMARFSDEDPGITPDQYQRIVEGRHLDTRIFLRKYERVIEGQRQQIARQRRDDPRRRARPGRARDLARDHRRAVGRLPVGRVRAAIRQRLDFARLWRPARPLPRAGARDVRRARRRDRGGNRGAAGAGRGGRTAAAAARRDMDVSDDRRAVRPHDGAHHAQSRGAIRPEGPEVVAWRDRALPSRRGNGCGPGSHPSGADRGRAAARRRTTGQRLLDPVRRVRRDQMVELVAGARHESGRLREHAGEPPSGVDERRADPVEPALGHPLDVSVRRATAIRIEHAWESVRARPDRHCCTSKSFGSTRDRFWRMRRRDLMARVR